LSRFERSGWRCGCKLRGGERVKLEFNKKRAVGWLMRERSLCVVKSLPYSRARRVSVSVLKQSASPPDDLVVIGTAIVS
jgi:hypothetical protein